MDAHRQELHPYQIPRKLLTEWKNTKKQKCTVLDSVSRDPEELTAAAQSGAGTEPLWKGWSGDCGANKSAAAITALKTTVHLPNRTAKTKQTL